MAGCTIVETSADTLILGVEYESMTRGLIKIALFTPLIALCVSYQGLKVVKMSWPPKIPRVHELLNCIYL